MSGFEPSKLTRGILPEAPLRLVDVAPRPCSPGHYGSHNGMARLMEVPCRVLAGRRVAAADMAARLALPELDPCVPSFRHSSQAPGVRGCGKSAAVRSCRCSHGFAMAFSFRC